MYVWYQQCEVRFVGVCCECECRHLLLTAIVAGKMVIACVHILIPVVQLCTIMKCVAMRMRCPLQVTRVGPIPWLCGTFTSPVGIVII